MIFCRNFGFRDRRTPGLLHPPLSASVPSVSSVAKQPFPPVGFRQLRLAVSLLQLSPLESVLRQFSRSKSFRIRSYAKHPGVWVAFRHLCVLCVSALPSPSYFSHIYKRTLALSVALAIAPLAVLAHPQDLAAKSQRAKEFMAQGKFADAVPLYRDLNVAVPNNPGLLLNLGMALHMAGDQRKSIPPLEAAVKLDPQLAPAWLFLATARLQLGQTATAIDALKTILQLQPDHQQARELLANALLSVGRAIEAADQYQKLAELNPASPPAWYGLGRSYEFLSNRSFDELQKAAPESAYWLGLVADTRLPERQDANAFYLYRHALQKAPAVPGLPAGVGGNFLAAGPPGRGEAAGGKEKRRPP